MDGQITVSRQRIAEIESDMALRNPEIFAKLQVCIFSWLLSASMPTYLSVAKP